MNTPPNDWVQVHKPWTGVICTKPETKPYWTSLRLITSSLSQAFSSNSSTRPHTSSFGWKGTNSYKHSPNSCGWPSFPRDWDIGNCVASVSPLYVHCVCRVSVTALCIFFDLLHTRELKQLTDCIFWFLKPIILKQQLDLYVDQCFFSRQLLNSLVFFALFTCSFCLHLEQSIIFRLPQCLFLRREYRSAKSLISWRFQEPEIRKAHLPRFISLSC